MAMSYYKTFAVPGWVILGKTKRDDVIMDWFKDAGARIQEWPSASFPKTLESFKGKGWRHVFTEKTVVIPPQLLAQASEEHARLMSPYSNLSYLNGHRIDRIARTPEDMVKMYDEILLLQDAIAVSQLFQVQEICYDDNKRIRPQLWITQEPCDRSVISKIANKIITIGEGTGFDVNIRTVKNEDMGEFLAEKMVAFNQGR